MLHEPEHRHRSVDNQREVVTAYYAERRGVDEFGRSPGCYSRRVASEQGEHNVAHLMHRSKDVQRMETHPHKERQEAETEKLFRLLHATSTSL